MADKKTPNSKDSSNKAEAADVTKAEATKTSVARKTTKVSSNTKQKAAQSSQKAAQPSRVKKPATSTNKNTKSKSVNTTETMTTTESESVPAPVTQTPTTHAPAKNSNGLAILALLLSLGALAASGYLVYANTVKNVTGSTNLAVGLTEIQGNVGRISDAVTNLKGDIQQINTQQSKFVNSDAVTQQLQQQIAPIKEQQATLGQTLSTVRQQVSGDDSKYVLNKIAQLLETANVELNLSKDKDSALLALGLAEEQIRLSSNRSLDAVRTKILADIEAIKASERTDLAGISAKIIATSSAVETWPLQNEPNAELIENKLIDVDEESESSGFLAELKKAASDMARDAVRVQKVDAAPKPLLVPEQRYFLNQNLRLHLLTAQNAALQGEQAIYQQNLASATQWVKEYFDLRDQRVQNALKDLDGISNIKLKPEVYDISTTLKSFNDITANPNKG